MKKKLSLLIIFFIITFSSLSFANNEEILNEQKENFGISDFINETEKYAQDFWGEDSIGDMLDNAIKGKINNNSIYPKILNILGKEVKNTIKTLLIILVIVLIHSVLKTISDSLENTNISRIIYYVQYILIVTVILSNFTDIITMVKDTADNLVGFMNTLVPLLISLMLFTGNIVTTGVIEPVILFMINFLGNMIEAVLIPFVLVITVLSIISKVSSQIQVDRLSKFLKSSVVWFLGIVLTLFVGVISLEGTLSSTVDGITVKTTKAAVSNIIPVVGKTLGDAVDTVLGCGVVLKNAVGVIGVLVLVGICVIPIIKLGILTISYHLAASVIQPIADDKIVKLLGEMGDVFKVLLAILSVISVMLIIGVTLVIKISNSGMMYR